MFGQFIRRAPEHVDGLRGSLVAVIGPIGGDHLEAVTAGVPQASYADPGSDIGQIAPRQHPHRVTGSQRSQCFGRPVHQGGLIGLVDDLRQRAVEVEEQCRPVRTQHPDQLVERCERVGQGGHPPVDVPHRDFGQVADNCVGPTRGEFGACVAGAIHTDDQSETTGAGGGDTGLGILHDDRACGPHTESACRLDQHCRIRFARQRKFRGHDTVHPNVEKVCDTS